MKLPRRTFIKLTGAAAAAAAVSGAGVESAVSAGQEKSILIDISKCTGCRVCVLACKQWNRLPSEENKFSKTDNGSPYFSAINWINIVFKQYINGADGGEKWIYTRQSCMHCRNAACVIVCPANAITHNEFGAVVIDEKKCIGCNYCIANCTFNVVGFDQSRNIARKCTLCSDRLAQGLAPACAHSCPTGALTFGDRSDILNLAGARVEELKKNGHKNVELYGLSELEGLQMVYVLSEGKEDSQAKYGLPEDPRISASAQVWSYLFKPVRAFLVMVLAFALWVNKSESKHAE